MEHTTADRLVPRSKVKLGFSGRPLTPQTNPKIFELDDELDHIDASPSLAQRPTSGSDIGVERFPILRRGAALASDAVVLTLASPFFAVWMIFRGLRAIWRRAIPAATEGNDAEKVIRASERPPFTGR